MKDEEFRKLLVEYAKEISDPENKKVGFIAGRILVVKSVSLFILLVDCNIIHYSSCLWTAILNLKK